MTEIKNPTVNDIGGTTAQSLSLSWLTEEKLVEIVKKVRATNPEEYKFFQKFTVIQQYCRPDSNHIETWEILVGEVRSLTVYESDSQCLFEREIMLVPLTETVVVSHHGEGGQEDFDILYVFTAESGWRTFQLR
jgi:hypothetical protein